MARAARASLLAALLLAVAAAVAAGRRGRRAATSDARGRRRACTGDGRPPLAVVAREGDARGAVAAAVTMEGLASEQRRGAGGGASAALVEARLLAARIDATAVGGWGGWRVRALVASAAEAARVVDAIARGDARAGRGRGAGARRAWRGRSGRSRRRPLPDRARCRRGAVHRARRSVRWSDARSRADAAELESVAARGAWGWAGGVRAWRARARGARRRGRRRARERSGPWRRGRAAPAGAPRRAATRAPSMYDASGEVAAGGGARGGRRRARRAPEQAVAAPRRPSATRAGRSRRASRRSRRRPACGPSSATAHVRRRLRGRDAGPRGARSLGGRARRAIATAAALARQEVARRAGRHDRVARPRPRARDARAADPRDAAERAAWWTLAGRRPARGEELGLAHHGGRGRGARLGRARARRPTGDALRVARSTARPSRWHAPVVEARTRVERGQGEAWVLLASPCGTLAEATGDAGARRGGRHGGGGAGERDAGDARVEPFVTPDGVGVARPRARARRASPRRRTRGALADVAARAFAADPLDPRRAPSQARTALLARARRRSTARALGALGERRSRRGHPSWIAPFGTAFGLGARRPRRPWRRARRRCAPGRCASRCSRTSTPRRPRPRSAPSTAGSRAAPARRAPAPRSPPPRRRARAPTPSTCRGRPRPRRSSRCPSPPATTRRARRRRGSPPRSTAPSGLLAQRARRGGGLARPRRRSPARRVGWARREPGARRARRRPRPTRRSTRRSRRRARCSIACGRAPSREADARARRGASRAADLAAALDPRARLVALWRGEPPLAGAPRVEELRAFAAALAPATTRSSSSRAPRPRPPEDGRSTSAARPGSPWATIACACSATARGLPRDARGDRARGARGPARDVLGRRRRRGRALPRRARRARARRRRGARRSTTRSAAWA